MKNGEKLRETENPSGGASRRCPKIPQEEHLVDVRKSANIGHLRDENHLIDVHLAEMWAPEEEEEEEEEEEGQADFGPVDT